jgi:hypothetical protein
MGANTITLTRPGGGNGFGYDTLVLEVDEPAAPPPAVLSAKLTKKSAMAWVLTVTNTGKGPANDARLDGLSVQPGNLDHLVQLPAISGRDPNRFPIPLGNIPAGGSATADIEFSAPPAGIITVTVPFSANGGRAHDAATFGLD